MARRPASRAGRRARSHHHLRRPRRRHRSPAAVHGRRRRGPDRHQRRAGTDRRRHDRGNRRAVLRSRAGAGRRAGKQDRGDLEKSDGTHRNRRFRRGTCRQSQAGDGPCRSRRDGSGGNRARRRSSRQADGRRATGTAARATADVKTAVQIPAVQEAIAGRTIYRQDTIRMFGLPESGLAETLREAEHEVPDFDSLEITTCLRRGEIEMVTRYEPDAADTYRQLTELLRDRHGQYIFSEDGAQVDDQVAQLLAGRRVATAESCTGGLLAARLTDRPGSSAYLAGGLVAYANDTKADLLGVDPALIDRS